MTLPSQPAVDPRSCSRGGRGDLFLVTGGCVVGRIRMATPESPDVRVRVCDARGTLASAQVRRGRFAVHGLPTGVVRVEVVGPRSVVARRVRVRADRATEVDFLMAQSDRRSASGRTPGVY